MQDKRRPIVIDGSNVAYARSNQLGYRPTFDSRDIQVCVNYFVDKGFKDVTAVVPEFRLHSSGQNDTDVLQSLKSNGHLKPTPWFRRMHDGRLITSYDDWVMIEIACRNGGIIVSNDRYRDWLGENPQWKETIRNRVLPFRIIPGFVPEIMFPENPLGRFGPKLAEFLRF